MAFIMHDDGESSNLQIFLTGEQTKPSTWGLGLCNDTLVEADRISDIAGEPYGTESGYSRQLIAADSGAWTMTKTDPAFTMAADPRAFVASGASMGTVNTWFITNEGLSGELGGSANLIASGPISPSRTVADGDTLNVTAYLSVK